MNKRYYHLDSVPNTVEYTTTCTLSAYSDSDAIFITHSWLLDWIAFKNDCKLSTNKYGKSCLA